jgi:hypothetical protein
MLTRLSDSPVIRLLAAEELASTLASRHAAMAFRAARNLKAAATPRAATNSLGAASSPGKVGLLESRTTHSTSEMFRATSLLI